MIAPMDRRATSACTIILAVIAMIPGGCATAPKPPAPALNRNPDAAYVRGDAVDDAVQGWMKTQVIPGLMLAVVKDGQVFKITGYGLADVRRRIPVGPDTAFRIYSLSKPFLAVGVMMLVGEGKVGLDDPVSRYI